MKLGLGLSLPSMQRRRDTIAFDPDFDPDAASYIAAVETADGQALEEGVREAINDFVVGCKADAIWDALEASCILAGARTLNGALVPLVGAAPTNFNFVPDDYNRVTGLKGNGSTKYLDGNRANNANPQNENHNAIWASQTSTVNGRWMGSWPGTGANLISGLAGQAAFRSRTSDAAVNIATAPNQRFIGMSRSNADNVNTRRNGVTTTDAQASQTTNANNVLIFGADGVYTDARLSFYSIGEAIDLAALDARVSALMTALDGAIA